MSYLKQYGFGFRDIVPVQGQLCKASLPGRQLLDVEHVLQLVHLLTASKGKLCSSELTS